MNISFAWTVPALLAGEKSRTRRQWDADYARRFTAGQQALAFDRSPRFAGRPVALIELTAAPVLEPISAMPDKDFEREGFGFFERHPEAVPASDPLGIRAYGARRAFERWREAGGDYYIVDFKLLNKIASRQ
jgi:hypothetical protein